METESKYAKEFKELLDIYNLQQHVAEPTHVKGHTIDVVVTPDREPYLSHLNVTQLDLSHHFLIDFKIIAEPNIRPQKMISYRSTKNVDLEEFSNNVTEKLNELPETTDMLTKVNR